MNDLLRKNRASLVQRWIDATLELYPKDSTKRLRVVKDPFANPIGATIKTELDALFDAFVDERPRSELAPHVERIVKITCIQEVSPSQAIDFTFKLKKVIGEALPSELVDPKRSKELANLDARIEDLTKIAFDTYVDQIKRIADIRVNEARRRVATLLKMAQENWDDLQ